jgi:hypothetical protein
MRVSLRGLYPQYTFFSGAISELDKAMTVAKHKGASVAGGRRQVNVAVGRDRRMVAALPVRALNGDDVEAVT